MKLYSPRSSIDRSLLALILVSANLPSTFAIHHMKRAPVHWVNKRDSSVPLTVTNQCAETIYPGIQTQAGTGPSQSGFQLNTGDSQNLTVSADWQGRVWGRTNCSFNADGTAPANGQPGQACLTGDCGGTVACNGTGQVPATLAEFTLQNSASQTFYDLSLVDGYNLPMGIISLLGSSGNGSDTDIPPNLTNPMCIATAALLAAQGDNSASTFGTNSTFPIPLATDVSQSDVSGWCPWDLQLAPPQKPGDGVYPYPDDNIQRPQFDPCLSACAKWNQDKYCCTGSYDNPKKCQPSDYSTQAKKVCPDAYSYAFDDQTSTFIIPAGGGFEVVFCPASRSSTILDTFSDQLHQLAQTGHVTPQIVADSQNQTLFKSDANSWNHESIKNLLAVVTVLATAISSTSWT